MNNNVSIVRVDRRPYRQIAQENWGLTDEQMQGMHVHHRLPLCKNGTNDPSNLYVCSPSFHKEVWHSTDGFNSLIPYAEEGSRKGARLGGLKTLERRSGIFKLSRECLSNIGKKSAAIIHADKDETGRSLHAIKIGKIGAYASHQAKDEQGKSIKAVSAAATMNAQKWEDPDHPELGSHSSGVLVCMQKRRGYPHGKENRRLVCTGKTS